jgi:hypothetical protein
LLACYRRLTGDDVQQRIPAFLTAYTAFRMGYCKMAADAMAGSDEEARLTRDLLKYRQFLAQRLRDSCGTPVLADASIAQPKTAVPHSRAA